MSRLGGERSLSAGAKEFGRSCKSGHIAAAGGGVARCNIEGASVTSSDIHP